MNTAKCFWNVKKGRISFEKTMVKKTDSDLDKDHDFMELPCPDPVLSDPASAGINGIHTLYGFRMEYAVFFSLAAGYR